ncbi:MAG TPA: hypothetical protein VHN15_11425 [Thermoanaerobaculia bacterium]|nr:hypothetical protein [Thermoanaerobaculia bacterium]
MKGFRWLGLIAFLLAQGAPGTVPSAAAAQAPAQQAQGRQGGSQGAGGTAAEGEEKAEVSPPGGGEDAAGASPNDRSARILREWDRRAQQHLAAIPELAESIQLLRDLVLLSVTLSLLGFLSSGFLIALSLRRGKEQPAAPAASPEPEKSPERVDAEPVRGPVQEISPPPYSARVQAAPPPAPQPRAQERIERPAAPPPPPVPERDEFTGLPHAAVGRTLSQLHRALPDLASRLPDPRQQERILRDLDGLLKARIERFKQGSRKGDAYLKEHWIEQDLVTTLNTLAQWLSSTLEERYRGRRGNRILEEELQRWLYERLAPVCKEAGWFKVEPILPFTTRFDPKIHYSVGSVELEGADDLVVTVKTIGRRDPQQGFVTHKAEVIVGR